MEYKYFLRPTILIPCFDTTYTFSNPICDLYLEVWKFYAMKNYCLLLIENKYFLRPTIPFLNPCFNTYLLF